MPDRSRGAAALRVVLRRAEAGSPVRVMAKVYRLADRIAARWKQTVERGTLVVTLLPFVAELP